DLVREIGFASAYSFKYSPRPGTPAAAMLAQISEDVKNERLARLQTLLFTQQTAFNQAQIGAALPVLVTGAGRRPGHLHGRSPFMQAVHFEGATARPGEIVDVRVIGASQNSLTGAALASTPATEDA